MKYIRIYFLALMATLLFAGCADDEFAKKTVQDGLPARVSVSVDVLGINKIAVTRAAAEYEYRVSELALVMFSQEGRRQVITLNGSQLTAGTASNEAGITYTSANTIEKDASGDPILSGDYDVYVIANYEHSICPVDLDAIQTKADAEAAVATLASNALGVSGTQGLPMTDYLTCAIAPATTDAEVTKISDISLRRVSSKIEFTFASGSHEDAVTHETVNVKFTPKAYTVYNLPKKANLIDKRDNGTASKSGSGVISDANVLASATADDYFDSDRTNIPSSSFSFIMMENNQAMSESCSDFNAREKWDGLTAGKKQFINAPEYGTYVVVEGEYEDKDYKGTISYTIHLGNFSPTNHNDYNNFKVNRNEHQTYKVTVNGVNDIVTEAENTDEEQQHGGKVPSAEGSLTRARYNFVLDAHYEAVMLKIDPASWATFTARNEHVVHVETPQYTSGTGSVSFVPQKYTFTKQADGTWTVDDEYGDYRWIQFQKPSDITEIPRYNYDPEHNRPYGTYEQYRESHDVAHFFADPEKFAANDAEGNMYVAVFVDEFYYDELKDELNKWVNTNDRKFICDYNADASNVSLDGNCEVVGDYLFTINQRSIKTVYDLNGTSLNPFGIETWNEFPAITDAEPYNVPYEAKESLHGWKNTKALAGITTSTSSAAPSKANGNYATARNKAGYLKTISGNTKAEHKYEGVSVSSVLAACISHNRDKNGNGKIDEEELEWYLPALNQYLYTWLGTDELNEDTRLFETADFKEVTVSSSKPVLNGNPIYHMWTSSPLNQRVWWQEQAVTYGNSAKRYSNSDETTTTTTRNSTWSSSNSWDYDTYEFRAVRSLRDTKAECSVPYQVDLVGGTDGNANAQYRVTVKTISAKRKGSISGMLTLNHLMTDPDEQNLLPEKFQIATATSVNGSRLSSALPAEGRNLKNMYTAAGSFQQTSTSDPGTWRIANQRELMIIAMIDKYTKNLTSSNGGYYACCTLHPAGYYLAPFYYKKTATAGNIGGYNTLLNQNTDQYGSSNAKRPYLMMVKDVE